MKIRPDIKKRGRSEKLRGQIMRRPANFCQGRTTEDDDIPGLLLLLSNVRKLK